MSEDKMFLDKEVSMLNLLPPDLALDKTISQVSAENGNHQGYDQHANHQDIKVIYSNQQLWAGLIKR
eukprot:15365535-Ditylum_brightwellii.AAC.2